MAIANPQGGFLTLLKKRNFIRLWLAQLISMTILNASNYALIVLIEEITGSTTLVGLAIICFSIPAVIFGAPAGVFVDRMNKRRVLWGSNCLRAIATFGFVFTLFTNRKQLVALYLLTFLISTIGQFFTPAEGSAIPMLVEAEEIPAAISLFNITFMLSQAVGFILLAPLIISLLPTFHILGFAIFPIDSLYILIGILYLVCAVLIAMIPPSRFKHIDNPTEQHAKAEESSRSISQIVGTIWQEMNQGWTFIRRKSPLLIAVIQLSFAGVVLLVIGELATPFVTRVLELPASAMAFVFAPAGIGLVLGSLIMPRLIDRLGKSKAIMIGSVAFTIILICMPLSSIVARLISPTGWHGSPLLVLFVAILMFGAGIALDLINIPAQTAVQELTPEWIKGRVLALQLMLYNAFSIPIILGIGAIADIFSVPVVIYILAISVALFGVWSVMAERKNPAPRLGAGEATAATNQASVLQTNSPQEVSVKEGFEESSQAGGKSR
ncbi:MAG TPA: MFS transporter [Ktedonobacteraceae bacterium]|nr:MFS transporter [Ktedonobacteraceae bacterium]